MSCHRAAAVLFDMDGLLVDTEPVWTRAEIELAARYGCAWTPEVKAQIAGTRLERAVPLMLAAFGQPATPEHVAEASTFLLDRMVDLFATDVRAYPGALDLVDAVRAAGVPTALVSSSYRVLMDAVLKVIGPHRFDLSLAGDEVRRGKPDPEPYLTACARLGVQPECCVVLEDSISGVRAGEAAGCVVVVVPDVAPVPETPRRPVVPSLDAIDLSWLLGLPAAAQR